MLNVLNQYFVKYAWGWTFLAGIALNLIMFIITLIITYSLPSPADGLDHQLPEELHLAVRALHAEPGETGCGDRCLVSVRWRPVSLC